MTKAELRELKIYNSWDFARFRKSSVFVCYRPQETGRRAECASWQVIGTDFETDKDAAWYDFGRKTFIVFRPRLEKQKQLKCALDWCKEQFSIQEFERDAWGSYHPKGG